MENWVGVKIRGVPKNIEGRGSWSPSPLKEMDFFFDGSIISFGGQNIAESMGKPSDRPAVQPSKHLTS